MEEQKFIIGIDVNKNNSFLILNNISINGTIYGLDKYNKYCNSESVKEIEIEKLKDHKAFKFTFMAPRLADIVYSAAMVRNGLRIGIGMPPNTKFYSKEMIENIVKKADMELAFEKIRREKFSDKPSRLSSFFICEDNIVNRNVLNNLFHNHCLIVEIEPIEWNTQWKFDMNWVDLYYESNNDEYIEKYWNQLPSVNPFWEYLIESGIKLKNEESRIFVREFYEKNILPTLN